MMVLRRRVRSSMDLVYTIKIDPVSLAIADLTERTVDVFEINRINVPLRHRGKGYGRELLQRICKDADTHGSTLELVAMTSGEMSQDDLISWYIRYGFQSRSVNHLVRYPKPKEAVAS